MNDLHQGVEWQLPQCTTASGTVFALEAFLSVVPMQGSFLSSTTQGLSLLQLMKHFVAHIPMGTSGEAITHLSQHHCKGDLLGERHGQVLSRSARQAGTVRMGVHAEQHVVRQQTGHPIQRRLQVLLMPANVYEAQHLCRS